MTILHHAIGNSVANTINATHARRMLGKLDVIPSNIRLSCILNCCIFHAMIQRILHARASSRVQ